MARNRHSEGDEAAHGAFDERRRLVAATALFAAVAVILVLGAVLRTSAPDHAPPAPPRASRVTAALGASAALDEPSALSGGTLEPSPAESEPALEDSRPTAVHPLEKRAAGDRERLVRSGGSYTVQLMVACDPVNASRVVDAAGDVARLYVLPFTHDDKACYRVCWGSYATRQSAETAVDLPENLAAMFPNTRVRPVADVTS